MQGLDCEKHQLKRNFIFCLEPNCDDGLVCKRCLVLDKKHIDHRFIMVKPLLKDDEYEVKRIFDNEYIEKMKNDKDAEQFVKQFDDKFNKYLNEREEELRTPFERMIADYRQSLEKLKQDMYDRSGLIHMKSIEQIKQNIKNLVESDNSQEKQKSVKDQINDCTKLKGMQKVLDQVIKQFQQASEQAVDEVQKVFNKLQAKQDAICKQNIYNVDLEYVKQLKQCENEINVKDSDQINNYMNQIKQFQEQNKEYRIYVNFSTNTNSGFKQQVVDMIDELEVNHKVAKLLVEQYNKNKINIETLVKIAKKYNNLYHIYIRNYDDQVDNQIQDQFKIIVQKSSVFEFNVCFYRKLNSNAQGLKLLKEYNEIIKTKTHLEQLYYHHSKIDKNSRDKQEIEQMIKSVCDM